MDSKVINVLIKLSEIADDYQRTVLEDLAIKAGFWWRCPKDNDINVKNETCACGDAEPTEESFEIDERPIARGTAGPNMDPLVKALTAFKSSLEDDK
jgi:hypothetical protein